MIDVLEVLIGTITVFLVFSIVVTSVVEAISSLFKLRARNLEKALKTYYSQEIDGKGKKLYEALKDDPILGTLYRDKNLPSYVGSDLVAKSVIGFLQSHHGLNCMQDITTEDIRKTIARIPDSHELQSLLHAYLDRCDGSVDGFIAEVENHFDTAMDRASGWFKRYVQRITILVASVLVGSTNLNTIEIVRHLSDNPESRAALIMMAENHLLQAEQYEEYKGEAGINEGELEVIIAETELARKRYIDSVSQLSSSGIPIGWNNNQAGDTSMAVHALGLIISAFAVSLGAPFWFDLLSKFMRVRSTGTEAISKP